jgi:hypothetical protein
LAVVELLVHKCSQESWADIAPRLSDAIAWWTRGSISNFDF